MRRVPARKRERVEYDLLACYRVAEVEVRVWSCTASRPSGTSQRGSGRFVAFAASRRPDDDDRRFETEEAAASWLLGDRFPQASVERYDGPEAP